MLHNLLSKYEFLFDGKLGTWKTKPVDIELQPGTICYIQNRTRFQGHKNIYSRRNWKGFYG